MTSDLIRQLLDAALILFGAFHTNSRSDVPSPFALQLEMLASYPVILRQAAQATTAHLADYPRVDRLLCRGNSLALGTMVSQSTGIPLTYFDDQGHDVSLIGAYDIGHPTVLIANDQHDDRLAGMILAGKRVGLDIIGVVALMGWGKPTSIGGTPITTVLSLETAILTAVEAGILPAGQAAVLREWMSAGGQRPAATLHPGSRAP